MFHHGQQCFTSLTCSRADNPTLLVFEGLDFAIGIERQNYRFAIHSSNCGLRTGAGSQPVSV